MTVEPRRTVTPPGVRGHEVRQRVARCRQPQTRERAQVGREDHRLPVDVGSELGRRVPDVCVVLVEEADVDIRPMPGRPGLVVHSACGRPELDVSAVLEGRVVGLEVDQRRFEATSIFQADDDIDVVVPRHHVVMAVRAEQRSAVQHIDDAELIT